MVVWWHLAYWKKQGLSLDTYQDEILQSVVIPYLHSLGPNSILQEDNAHTRLGFIRTWRWRGSPDLNPSEHLQDQLGNAVVLE